MWPEFLKALRGGLVFNPLTEVQKRATQFGENLGTELQAKRAQAGYAKAHPASRRAQTEMMTNAAMTALSMMKGGSGEPPRFPGDEPGVAGRIGPKGIWSKWFKAEKEGIVAPPIHGKLISPNGKMAGYIQPANVDEAGKLAIRNEVSQRLEQPEPGKPNLRLLDSLAVGRRWMRADDPSVTHRGEGRPLTAEDRRNAEFKSIDSTWAVAHGALQDLIDQVKAEPGTRRKELADALRGGPKPPEGIPELLGQYTVPGYIPTVDAVRYAKQLPRQFQQMIKESQAAGNVFYTGDPNGRAPGAPHRTEQSKAIDIEIAARNVVRQGQVGAFVPPHATDAEATAIIHHGKQVAAGLHKIDPSIMEAFAKAIAAARFLHLK